MDRQPEILPQKAEQTPILVDHDRVEAVLSTLLDAYEKKYYPYSQDKVRLPQDERHMPETLEKHTPEHAMFFWNVCYYMRGGTKSTFAVQQMSKLYNDRPDLFDTAQIVQTTEEDIATELTAHSFGFQKTVSKQWLENAHRLNEHYDGDPRNIFADVTTYDELLPRIKNDNKGGGFMGFREKMTSMIAYYLMDEGVVEPFNFPIPVDLHVMRVSIENKLVTFPGVEFPANVYNEGLLSTLRKVYFDYSEKHGVNPLRLCDAVWLLSESMCGSAPGNRTTEPLGREQRNGRSTLIVPETVDIHDAAQINRYERTCRKCPVEDTCELNVLGGNMYYAIGQVAVRGERVRFPDNSLFNERFLNNHA